MNIILHKKPYSVESDEFVRYHHPEYQYLEIYPVLNTLDRCIGLIRKLRQKLNITKFVNFGSKYGGYIPINVSQYFDEAFVINPTSHYLYNHMHHNDKCVIIEKVDNVESSIIHAEQFSTIPPGCHIIISHQYLFLENYHTYALFKSDITVSVHDNLDARFIENFLHYFENGNFNYNNCLHLCMIVKNAGEQFADVLAHNIPYFDQWTILDTGSTDGTVETIKKVLHNKPGQLYQEPFVDFSTSRNRCLELAGDECSLIIMLDDTHKLQGNVLPFFELLRSDQFGDAYAIKIETNNEMHGSVVVMRPYLQMSYRYPVHEILDTQNKSVPLIPMNEVIIEDYKNQYMITRTSERKIKDLEWLHKSVLEDPNEARHYYYLGQTYSEMGQWELAAQWFESRTKFQGYIDERVEALIQVGWLHQFKLNSPWEFCQKWYEEAATFNDFTALYCLAEYYQNESQYDNAYYYYTLAFNTKINPNTLILRQQIYNTAIPKGLMNLCQYYNNYLLGCRACERILSNGDDSVVQVFYEMYQLLSRFHPSTQKIFFTKPIVCAISTSTFNVDVSFQPENINDILCYFATYKIERVVIESNPIFIALAYEAHVPHVELILPNALPYNSVLFHPESIEHIRTSDVELFKDQFPSIPADKISAL